MHFQVVLIYYKQKKIADPLCNHAEMMLQRQQMKKLLYATQNNIKSVFLFFCVAIADIAGMQQIALYAHEKNCIGH